MENWLQILKTESKKPRKAQSQMDDTALAGKVNSEETHCQMQKGLDH